MARNDVCMVGVNDEHRNVSLAKAGAVAEYVRGGVVFCGGRSVSQIHSDCLVYNPTKDHWGDFPKMIKARDEASSATAGNVTYVMGGIGEKSVEFIDMSDYELDPLPIPDNIPKSRQTEFEASNKPSLKWKLGPSMPEIRSRGCGASSPDGEKVYVIGKFLFFFYF